MYSIMNYIIDLIDDGFITKDEFIFQFKDILDKQLVTKLAMKKNETFNN